MSRREWTSEVREPWCPLVYQLTQAIDRHNRLYFQTLDPWHLAKAEQLRAYARDLKAWIYVQENRGGPGHI